MTYHIAAFYRFTPVADVAAVIAALKPRLRALGICGTMLVAPEGVNGTMAAPDESGIAGLADILVEVFGMDRAEIKYSHASEKPFKRLKVRPKKELITFKQEGADPTQRVGTYVEPEDWNALIDDPEVLLLDTRNVYETMIGTYDGAVVPPINVFTEFADYVRAHLKPDQTKKVAMFCTGGIRCEKASAFMLSEGFGEVYHLKGGILKYLETVPQERSKWHGECYVFDRRMSVGHGLETGRHGMCFSCGYPLDADDTAHPLYEAGVSCRHCHAQTDEAQKDRFRMRQRQIEAGEIAF